MSALTILPAQKAGILAEALSYVRGIQRMAIMIM